VGRFQREKEDELIKVLLAGMAGRRNTGPMRKKKQKYHSHTLQP